MECRPRPSIRLPNRGPPRGRRIMMVEWDKLFAEAIEKDTKERMDFRFPDADSNDSDCCDSEEEEGEYAENEGNENDSEMPLNLCYKSNTAPNMSTRFEAESSPSRSTQKNPVIAHEGGKLSSCTVPNFQGTKSQHSVNHSCNGLDREPREKSDDLCKVKAAQSIAGSSSARKPMRELNNLDQNAPVRKISFELDKPREKSTDRSESKLQASDSQESKTNPDNVQCADVKAQKLHSDSCPDDVDVVGVKKQNESEAKETKSSAAPQKEARFAVPAVPEKVRNMGRTIVVNGKPYKVLAPLGKGGSSSVYLALNLQNELLAIKCVKLAGLSEKIRNDYLHEIQYLMKMQHSKHVIKLYDHQYQASNKVLYAVMEKGDTDLARFLKDKAASEEGITPESVLYYWNEMLLAVKSIHDNNIIHRDLKPANFLLVAGRLKLIDFGIASSIQNEETSILMNSQSGTFNYMSPEALLDLGSGNEVVLKIGRESDVWSLGCILYYFLYKKTPYQDVVKPIQKMRAITDPNHSVEFPKLPGVPNVLIESCRRCLVYDRKKRASIEELLDMKNKPLLTLSQVLSKLETALPEREYRKAVDILSREIT